MKICMITSESIPFCKTGGLADVVYSLSRKMVVYKKNVSIMMPFYKDIDKKTDAKFNFEIKFDVMMSWRVLPCEVYSCMYRDIRYYFIKNDFYFNREKPYGFIDDQERFAFFQNAALKFTELMGIAFDIIHLHDWQTGMIPLLYREQYKNKLKKEPKFIYTIHNAAFLGLVDRKDLYDYFNLSERFYDNGETRMNDKVSYMKTGIITSDRITTVSPTFANELLQDASNPLHPYLTLRKASFKGILNGIDTREWNPDTDTNINYNYTIENVVSQKAKNKKEFLEKYHMNPELPLLGVVSRLTSQKGINLILDSTDVLIKNKVNIVILGTGESSIEEKIKYFAEKYPNNFIADISYSDKIAHEIYAAADFFLMPSKFEPCGISQMLAQRYGTIPIARATGGLVDTIHPYNGANEEDADGILFTSFDQNSFLLATLLGLNLYSKKRPFTKIIHNAMNINNSWTNSFNEYYSLYMETLG